MSTQYIYQFERDDGISELNDILKMFRYGFTTIGDLNVQEVLDHSKKTDEVMGSGAIEYRLEGGSAVIIKPSEEESSLEVCISVDSDSEENAAILEKRIRMDLESIIYMNYRAGCCCE